MLAITLTRGRNGRAPKALAVPDYLAHEGLEHAERAQEHLSGDVPPLLRLVPLAAAILAVLAGLSSLYGNRLAESMISMGDEAVLDQTQAADTWNEFEAQSLKKHIESELVFVTTDPTAKRRFASLEKTYAARQKPLQIQAKNLEKQRSEALARMEGIEKQKARSDVATGLFQIAIVLASIAALTKRPALFTIGIAGGVVGLIYCVLAFFP